MRMSRRAERVLAVVGATAILIVGFDSVTYAKTGSSLLLGKANKAGGVTTVQNTGNGAALKLTTKSAASPPFTTNAKGLVKNLYSDRSATTDGLSSSALRQVERSIASGTKVRLVGAAGEPAFVRRQPFDLPEGWTNYGNGFAPVSFRKDPLGVVNLGGLLCPGGIAGASMRCVTFGGGVPGTSDFITVFTLPEGYRPATRRLFTVSDTERSARIDVLPTGDVSFQWVSGVTHSYISLEGISFVAEK
jgi:hypothetical protein